MGQVRETHSLYKHRHYNSSFHTGNWCWCQGYSLTKTKSKIHTCTLVNLRAGLLHNEQSVIKMKSQLHRLPQWAAVPNPFMEGVTFTHMELSPHNWEGWTLTPQTLSSHYVLIRTRTLLNLPMYPRAFSSSMATCSSSPRGLASPPSKLGLFLAGRESLLSCCIKKMRQLELDKVEGAWKANWLIKSHTHPLSLMSSSTTHYKDEGRRPDLADAQHQRLV